MKLVNFSNTAIAFEHKSNNQLKKAKVLFNSFNYPALLNFGPSLAKLALNFGMKGIIKNTIFEQFCGGETIEECELTIKLLASRNVGTILDYSVEGEETESAFDETEKEIIATIKKASNNLENIPFSVFKTTGIARFELLSKLSDGSVLSANEIEEAKRAKERFENICSTAFQLSVKLFVDAEESWIQPCIDRWTEEMMERFNIQHTIVYNTIQLYRHDRLAYLKQQIETQPYLQGYKLVRGAYMEKERARALEININSPIQPDKNHSDLDYNQALKLCIENIEKVSICAGTHNEESCMLLTELMKTNQIRPEDERVYFSQLLGMSDHISFNLANAGYKVAKYVPYGPVKSVIPYLTRRAKENSSVQGQVGRELGLIEQELKRRNG